MAALGLPVRRYKSYAAWVAEKTARLKLNGSLWSRSPLSGVVELEILRLDMEAKPRHGALCGRGLNTIPVLTKSG